MRVARLLMSFFLLSTSLSISAAGMISNDKADERIEQTAQLLTQGLNAGDAELLAGLYDFQQISRNAWLHAFGKANEKEIASVAAGIKRGFAQNYIGQTLKTLHSNGGEVTYKGIRTVDGRKVALIRFDLQDSGMNFQEISIDAKSGKIVDWFDYVLGARYSETLGNVFAVLMPEQSNLLGKMLGKREIDSGLVDKFKQFGLYKRQGEFSKAYNILEQLPQELNSHKTFIAIKTELAQHISLEEYNKQLALLAKHYSDDPTMALMLIDYYYDFDLKQVVKMIDGVQVRLGKDSLLEWLKSSVYFQLGEHSKAQTAIEYAISQEPEREKYYWTKIAIQTAQNDFKGVVNSLDDMEAKLNMEFTPKGFFDDEMYAEFVKSKAFADWRKKWE